MHSPGLIIIAIDDFAIHTIRKLSQGIIGNGGAQRTNTTIAKGKLANTWMGASKYSRGLIGWKLG